MSLQPAPHIRRRGRRARGRAQSIVEFGLVALVFTLLLMGVVDFGILLNGWLGVSSVSRDIVRQLAVGICPPQATWNYVPGVAANTPNAYYCQSSSDVAHPGSVPNGLSPSGLQIQGMDAFGPYAVASATASTINVSGSPWTANQLVGGLVTFTSGANSGVSRAITANTANQITINSGAALMPKSGFPSVPAAGDSFSVRMLKITVSICSADTTTCYDSTSPGNLLNYYPPATAGATECAYDNVNTCSPIHPTANDAIVVTVVAKIQVITPLVRPFFGCTGWFIDQRGYTQNNGNPRCEVPITSRAVARYEGPYI